MTDVARTLLAELQARGVEVQAAGDRLRIRPAAAVGPELLEAVRAHKLAILAALGGDGLAPCGSPHCAGCYDIGEGRKIHPPRSGPEWEEWLRKWPGPKDGRVQ